MESGDNGQTRLTAAIVRADESAVASVLQSGGGDLWRADGHGKTALHFATDSGSEDIARLCVQAAPAAVLGAADAFGRTALHNAARRGVASVVALLAERGAPLNATDAKGNTALHVAAAEGRVAAVEALLKCGADASLPNSAAQLPIELAADDACAALLHSALLQKGGLKAANQTNQDNAAEKPANEVVSVGPMVKRFGEPTKKPKKELKVRLKNAPQ